jgi:hypothetical protein
LQCLWHGLCGGGIGSVGYGMCGGVGRLLLLRAGCWLLLPHVARQARTRRPKWLRHGPESWSQGSNAGQLSAKRDRVASRLRHRHVLLLLEALLLLRRLLLLPLLRLLLRLLLLLLLLLRLLLRLLLLPLLLMLLLMLLLQLLMLLLQQALLCHVCAVRRLLLMLLLLRLLRQHRCRLRARPRASSVSVRGEEPSCRERPV